MRVLKGVHRWGLEHLGGKDAAGGRGGACERAERSTVRTSQARGAELVIALTHMRVPNDRKLAASVPGIDLVRAALGAGRAQGLQQACGS